MQNKTAGEEKTPPPTVIVLFYCSDRSFAIFVQSCKRINHQVSCSHLSRTQSSHKVKVNSSERIPGKLKECAEGKRLINCRVPMKLKLAFSVRETPGMVGTFFEAVTDESDQCTE